MTPDLAPGMRALSDVDYVLDVHVPAADLQPKIAEALKRERAAMTMKGFRPGKVPMTVVRKLAGPQIAIAVAEEAIGEAYRDAMEGTTLDVVGQPRLDELDFDVADAEADLKAVVRFGVRPAVALADVSEVAVTRLVRAFSDDDVEADLQRRRDLGATEEPAPEGTALDETHTAICSIQPVDADGQPIGVEQHDARLVMANPALRQEMKDALAGTTVGDTVTVELPHEPEAGASQHGADEGHEPEAGASHHDDHVDRYRVTVTGVMERVLPEMTPEWVQEQTQGRTDDLDALRAEAREELERSWARRADQSLHQSMVGAFTAAHGESVAVPHVLTESALDAMLAELREQSGGQLPPTFDVSAWREINRPQAEDQVRWLLVKDALIEQEGLEVTDDDLDAEMRRLVGDGASDEALDGVRAYFRQQEGMLDQMAEHLLNERVFGALSSRFLVVEKTREDLEREVAERRAAAEAASEAEAAESADDAGEASGDATDDEAGDDEAPNPEVGEAKKKRGLFGRRKD